MTTRITPPLNVKRHRRLRNRRIILVAVVVMALAGAGFAVTDYVADLHAEKMKLDTERARRCPGLDGTSGAGFALTKTTGEQCTGWIIERNYPFGSNDTNIKNVISKITEENRRVHDQSGAAEPKPYVRVGVLMPMTSAPGSAMSSGEILHSLQGAYIAQKQANQESPSELGDSTPLIQLVLANEGQDHSEWPAVVEQLAGLRQGDHTLVAVTGLSISIPATRDAAEALGNSGIPTIGAVITANEMVAPRLFKVSPSNRQLAEALRASLDNRPGEKIGYLAYDRNPEDSYVQSLKKTLTETFADTYKLAEHSRGFNGSKPPTHGPTLLSPIVDDICVVNPEVLFYSGRDRDLPALVEALKTRGRCQNPIKPLVIATVATGQPVAQDELDAAQVSLLYASATDHEAWRSAPDTHPRYAAFDKLFTDVEHGGRDGFPEADLEDGWAVMHRDAVAAAVWATRKATTARVDKNAAQNGRPPISILPTSLDVYDALFSIKEIPIPLAGGETYYTEQSPNGLWPSGRPVPIIRSGKPAEE